MYCLDTSALIDAWERYYPVDVFPGVWNVVDELMQSGSIVMSDEVFKEIRRKSDGVYLWSKKYKSACIPLDLPVQNELAKILATCPAIIDPRKNRSGADPVVIAVAMTRSMTVVTGERKANSLKKPKIPDVCDHFNVPWCNIAGMFRGLKLQFG
jgi:hypothetical protein